jgi:hypothetical protein
MPRWTSPAPTAAGASVNYATAFARERLEWSDAERVCYRLPRPGPDGRTELILSPP